MAILPSATMKMNHLFLVDEGRKKRSKGGEGQRGRRDERTVVRLQDVLEFACARHNGQEEG